jgi:hypothetical protein
VNGNSRRERCAYKPGEKQAGERHHDFPDYARYDIRTVAVITRIDFLENIKNHVQSREKGNTPGYCQ